MITRQQCLDDAGRVFTEALAEMLTTDPRVQAERAYLDGGPSVEELEDRIRGFQAENRIKRKAVA